MGPSTPVPISWIYSDTANQSSLCVLNQCLAAVRPNGGCPKFLRTNKGEETMLIAAALFRLTSQPGSGSQ